MSYLYIVDDNAVIGIDGGYYSVKYSNGDVKKIPSETVESIALFGNVSLTTPCTKKLLENGIPVSFFSKRGSYFGRLESTKHTNIFRLKKQIRLSDDDNFKIPLAQRILSAKINNQAVLLARYERSTGIDTKHERFMMLDSMEKVKKADSIDVIMGHEGNAAKNYFQGLSKVINPEFSFNGRNRMPPKDPFNSLLSLGYTMLMYEIYGEIENKGLNPYAGFIHSDRERHPTLASDLMEEWRPVIVDSVTMSIINGKEIDQQDFVKDESTGGVFLINTGMPKFIRKFEDKLRCETGYITSTYKMTFRNALWHQVNALVSAIEKNDPCLYEPIVIR